MAAVLTYKGDFKKTRNFLKQLQRRSYLSDLDRFGRQGVDALARATPKNTGETAAGWRYEIESDQNGVRIVWYNRHVHEGANIVLLLQYGHGTRNGGYVEGIDYINPALKPVFDKIAEQAWKEVCGK